MGKSTNTVTQSADPPSFMKPYLRDAASTGAQMFESGSFASSPYEGNRVAGFGDNTLLSQQMILDQANAGAPLTAQAGTTLSQMMDPSYTSSQLDAVKSNALGSAVPAAVAQFAGSGMGNSSTAMDTVGRAATDAIAPYEYGAFENAQGRAMSAAAMAPSMDQAAYMPASMIGSIGAQQDALSQANIDADMAKFYEQEGQEAANFEGYLNTMMGLGGMGGTTVTSSPGPSMLASLGGSGLTGLGTYGALAANPATAGFAIPGGIAAGLMGLF
ncbi:MAG: hypothetical protein AAFR21_11630 [Pseudomonadota bacterium]